MYQFSSGNEVASFYIETCCLIEKKKKGYVLLYPEFQNLEHCYKDQTHKSYKYRKLNWGVLKTARAIVISSKYKSTRQCYLHINSDNLCFKNWKKSIGVDTQLLSKNFFLDFVLTDWCIFIENFNK